MVKTRLGRDLGRRSLRDGDDQSKGGSVADRPATTATAAPTENGFQSDSSQEEQYVRRKRRRSCHDDSEDSSNCGRRRLRRSRYMDSNAMRSSLSYYERNRLHLRSQNSDALGIRRSTRQKKLLYKTYNQNLIDKQLSLMESDSEDDYVDKTKVKVSRRRRAPNYISEDDDLEDEETEDTEVEVEQVVKIKSRPRLKSSETAATNKDENDEELGEDATKDGLHKERNSHDLRRGRPRNADKMNHEAVEEEEEEEEEQPKQHHKRMEVEPIPEAEALDMYTRVKRERPRIKRDMYGLPINYDEKEEKSTSDSETQDQQSDDDDSDNAEQTKEKTTKNKSYNLRLHCRKTNLYSAPPIEPQRSYSRSVRTFRALASSKNDYRSPMRRRRKRAAFHSSTSSSSSSADEEQFERRKSKSMAKARQRCLPMNLTSEEVASGAVRDRMHSGASLADVEPMAIDKSVLFDSVGGLGKHLNALKEMILFPLLYPEVFSKFKITPPRGVLFHGPPGTGKTLVARALANECSLGNTKVAFFMRKGADCLSKWVGESERQLRLLFDQAYRMRPAIIFFDEIDGLAPVRSSRQDQIHSSIVSTLLALMDGLDDRGELVVIGATNRIHSIDPALRRPGRFDREFLFPLPSFEARKQIVKIHTKEWNPPLTGEFMADLARRTVGYCGADLKALCTEAALHALRRRYPQIYNSRDKLLIDVSTINILSSDFCRGMERIQPAAQRSSLSPAKALGEIVRPLLEAVFLQAVTSTQNIFPSALHLASQSSSVGLADDDFSDDDFSQDGRLTLQTSSSRLLPPICRPRLLLAGDPGQGQSSHLGPALLHHLENLAVNVMDLPSLFAVETRTPEESCTQIMREARRSSPSVLYIPHINDLWDVIGDAVRSTFVTFLQDFDPSTPVLVLATSELRYDCLPPQVRDLFSEAVSEVICVNEPDASKRKEFFENLILQQVSLPPVSRKKPERKLEVLPKAPNPEPRKLTAAEEERLVEQEEITLRELRLFLRDVINKLGRDRKFSVFLKPVDILEVPDYHEIIKNPMDLSTMMSRIDLHQYETVLQFLQDIDLICSNALEYNPDKDPQDRAIRHRACALKDTTNAIIATELDPEFGKLCEDIAKARKNRGYVSKTTPVPNFYFTKPLNTSTSANADGCTPHCGRRSQETKETNSSCEKTNKDNISQKTLENDNYPRKVIKKIRFCRSRKSSGFKSPWCRTNRRIYKKVVVYVDRDGREMSEGEFKKISSDLQTSKGDQQSHEKKETESNPKSSVAKVCISPEHATRFQTRRQLSAEFNEDARKHGSSSSKNVSSNSTTHAAESSSALASTSSKVECNDKTTSLSAAIHDHQTRKAVQSLVKALKTVVVDLPRLKNLLDELVQRTVGFQVDHLEKLHSQLSLCVYSHRQDYDKTRLIKELDNIISRIESHRRRTSEAEETKDLSN